MRKLFTIVLIAISINAYSQWQLSGLSGKSINCIVANGGNIFAGTSDGVYLSMDNGLSWNSAGFTGSNVKSLATNGTDLFLGGIGTGGVLLSTDNGISWTGLGIASQLAYQGNALAISGTNVYAGEMGTGAGASAISTDNGANWGTMPLNGYINTFAISGTNIFAGAGIYLGGGIVGAYLSTDNGTTWAPVNNGLSYPYESVHCFAINGNNIFAGTGSISGGWQYGGVCLSTNNGTSWSAVSTGLPNVAVKAMTSYGPLIFCGTINSYGVYISSNNGASWNNIGMQGNSINSLAISGDNIFAGTQSGIYKRLLSQNTSDTATFHVNDLSFASISPKIYFNNIDTLTANIGGIDSIVAHYFKYVFNANYCTDTSYISVTDTLVINTVLTGINPPFNTNTIKVYPNPASDHLYIDNGNYTMMNGYTCTITNALSQQVFYSLINQQQFYIDLSTWTGNGLYFVTIRDAGNTIIEVKKIVIQ